MKKLFISFVVMTALAVLMCSTVFADSLDGQDSSLPQVTGYNVYTDHSGDVDGSTDDQYVCLDVYYDSEISIESSEAVIEQLSISFGGGDLTSTSTASVTDDGKTLHLEMHYSFAGYSEYLNVESVLDGNCTLTAVTAAGTSNGVNFPEVSMYVSNGVYFEDVSTTVGTDDTAASVTKQVVYPSNATRAMVQMLFLVNGEPVGTLNSYGSNLIAHCHMYLTLDAETFASYIQSAFDFEGYTATYDGDTITITSDEAEEGEVLDIIMFSYPNDRDTNADKTELNSTITEVEDYIAENTNVGSDLTSELAIAESYAECIYYTQDQIDAETAKLIEALENDYSENVSFSETSSETGITLSADAGVISYGTTLSTVLLKEGDEYDTANSLFVSSYSNYLIYDISLYKDGVTVEPNGTITVTMDVPDEFTADEMAIYHIVDGVSKEVEFTVENGTITFSSDSLSPYVFVDLSSVLASDATTTTADTTTTAADTTTTTADTTTTAADTTTTTDSSPATGDSSNVWVSVICVIAAAVAISGVAYVNKKKKTEIN